MKKKLILLLSIVLVLGFITACSNDNKESAVEKSAEKEVTTETVEKTEGADIPEDFISIGTSSSGGTFNTLGVTIAQMWTDNMDTTRFTAEVTGGSSENVIRVGLGEIQMAFAASSSAYDAYHGVGSFEGKQIEGFSVIGNLYPAIMQMPVLKTSGIENLDDIVGKSINIGQAGSGSESQVLQILDVYGISLDNFSPSQMSHSNASDALVDEKLDGYIISGSLGQSHQMKSMSSGKCKLASFEPEEKLQKLIEELPYYYEYEIPAESYPNQTEPVKTVATGTLLIVNNNVSEELVYQTTKLLFENLELIASSQSIANEINLEDAVSIIDLKLHPGAERYYKEVGAIE